MKVYKITVIEDKRNIKVFDMGILTQEFTVNEDSDEMNSIRKELADALENSPDSVSIFGEIPFDYTISFLS